MQTRILGYGGGCLLDGVALLMTSGSVNIEKNPSYMQPYDIEQRRVWRSKVLYATGTQQSSGTVSFDMTWSASKLFARNRMFQRGRSFDVLMVDGVNGAMLRECYVTSVSASGSVGGIVTGSISFISANEWDDYSGSGRFMREDDLVGYWSSGNDNVRDWSVNFSQAVEPVFLNENTPFASYMKYGLCDISLEMTTYERIIHDSVTIAAGHITLTGIVTAEGYNYSGSSDVGTYSHSFSAVAELAQGSDAEVLR
jgi:hypothetical protein